jgi:dipeptidase E
MLDVAESENHRSPAVAELLLLSTSTSPGFGFLGHAMDEIAAMLPPDRRRVLFIPFASAHPGAYTELMSAALAPLAVQLTGAGYGSDPVGELGAADAVFVGGGNTFRLLRAMQDCGLLTAVADRARLGMPYLGTSAGAVLASPTLRTAGDLPIVEPMSLTALGLVPVQVSPHYRDADPASLRSGEAAEQRIEEFLECNDVPVLGLREGSWLRVSGDRATIGGTAGGRLFARECAPRELAPGTDVSELLTVRPRFDLPGG